MSRISFSSSSQFSFLAMQSIQFQELVQAWEDVLRAQDDMDKERGKGGLGLPLEAHIPDPPDAPLMGELKKGPYDGTGTDVSPTV